MKMKPSNSILTLIGVIVLLSAPVKTAFACTGITLKGADGSIVVARTFEWGAFDFGSRVLVVPRDHEIVSHTPDGSPGLTYTTKYGVVGIDAAGELGTAEGMNEEGLVVGAFYLPGFAEFQPYDKSTADKSLGPTELMLYLLSQFKTVEEVREGLDKIRVVPVVLEALGIAAPLHYRVVDSAGNHLIIEYIKGGELTLFEAPLKVITNSPTYDWHMNNVRNYIGLSSQGLPEKAIEGVSYGPFGAGSGMFGLPGDSTPPSRFIQAVAFTQTARKTGGGIDTVNEAFRILDHFNLGTSSAEGADISADSKVPSATQWTVAADNKNRVFYYHTAWNRRVRSVDLNSIDFDTVKLQTIPLDKDRRQDIEEVSVK